MIDLLLRSYYSVVFVYVAWVDWRTLRIPNRATYPAIGVALASLLWRTDWQGAILAGLLAAVLFLVPVLVLGPRRAGIGDVKLALLIGLVVGFPVILSSLIISFLVALPVAGMLLITRRKQRDTLVPFGPFLSLGGLIGIWLLMAAADLGSLP